MRSQLTVWVSFPPFYKAREITPSVPSWVPDALPITLFSQYSRLGRLRLTNTSEWISCLQSCLTVVSIPADLSIQPALRVGNRPRMAILLKRVRACIVASVMSDSLRPYEL